MKYLIRFSFFRLPVLCLSLLTMAMAARAAGEVEVIAVDASVPAHPFPHYWETTFGSGRAVLALRENYRHDLREVKSVTGFRYVRFHAILHDEVGVYDEDEKGNPVYNFSLVDQIYDGLLRNGVKPFIELSFMPRKLAAKEVLHSFWYKQNTSPPKDYAKWDGLMAHFTRHLVERYGIDEVATWYFEVWNEPNIDFWSGEPKQETYFELYDHTVRTIKSVNPRLRVGGPSTAQAAWVDKFIQHCLEKNVPVDFVSSHVYGNDSSRDVFGTEESIPRERMVCRAVAKVRDQVKASARPDLPIHWTEYNASYKNEPAVTDTIYMGAWLADTIRQCDGMVESLSYWTFSDVFEEQGIVKTPFYGGFGLIATGGIPKPSFNAFQLLHRLGENRIPVDSESALVTRRADGALVIALWNLFPPERAGTAKTIRLQLKGMKGNHRAVVYRVDSEHGNVLASYRKMGEPRYPTQAQIEQLRKDAKLPAPEKLPVTKGVLTLDLPPQGLAIVEIK